LGRDNSCYYGWIPTISGNLKIGIYKPPFEYIKGRIKSKSVGVFYESDNEIYFKVMISDKISDRLRLYLYNVLRRIGYEVHELDRRVLFKFRLLPENTNRKKDFLKIEVSIYGGKDFKMEFLRVECEINLNSGMVRYVLKEKVCKESLEKELSKELSYDKYDKKLKSYLTQIHIAIRDIFHDHVFHRSDRPLPPVQAENEQEAIKKILEKYFYKFSKYKHMINKNDNRLHKLVRLTKRFYGEVVYAESFFNLFEGKFSCSDRNMYKSAIERFYSAADALVKYKENVFKLKIKYMRLVLSFMMATIAIFGLIIQNNLLFLWVILGYALWLLIYYYLVYISVPSDRTKRLMFMLLSIIIAIFETYSLYLFKIYELYVINFVTIVIVFVLPIVPIIVFITIILYYRMIKKIKIKD